MNTLQQRIRQIAGERKAVILAHYYTTAEVQDVADFVGDSLALAQKAAQTDAEVIVMCGVHFMAGVFQRLNHRHMKLPNVTANGSDIQKLHFGSFSI